MRKLVDFNKTYSTLVAGAVSVVSPLLLDFVETRFPETSIAMVLTLSVVSVGVLVLSTIGEKLVGSSKRIRRGILGNEFIEDDWYDVSIEPGKKKIRHGVLITISFEDDQYHINGVTYTPEGHHIATFTSKICVYQHRSLFAKYESQTDYFQTAEYGVMEMQFDSTCTSYSGFYSDYTGKIGAKIHGLRVSAADRERYEDLRTAEDRRRFVVDRIKQRQAELEQIGTVPGSG